MHAMLRTYAGAGSKELFDALASRKSEVEAAIRAVPGLVSYTMVRTGDGGATITVCQDKASADESLRVAREWMQQNLPGIGGAAPAIAEGDVIVQIK